jgi:DNA-binding response OmpR family regulator
VFHSGRKSGEIMTPMKPKILVVDDEPDALELLETNLRTAGFEVRKASDGPEALRQVRAFVPALIVLDLMLPEMGGLEVCKSLRRGPDTTAIPILMLTARAGEIDRVVGLELGADDYVTKPFSPRELVLRIRNLLKRATPDTQPAQQIQFGALRIDLPRHHASFKGKELELTVTEFKLVALLAQRKGRVQSREQLLKDVWGYNSLIDTRTVDTHMRRLRDKLGGASKYLDTVRGVGYRFVED